MRVLNFKTIVQSTLIFACVVSASVQGQEPGSSILRDLAPVLDCQTVALANVSLESLDVEKSAEKILSLVSDVPAETDRNFRVQSEYFAKVAKGLVKAGAVDINIISRLGTLIRQERLIVIRCKDEAAAEKVSKRIDRVHVGFYGNDVKGNLVLLGWDKAFMRLPRIEDRQTQCLSAALDEVKNAPIRMAFMLSSDQKKAFIAGDSDRWDDGSPASVTNFQYLAAGIDINGQKFQAKVACESAESASAIAGKVKESLDGFASLKAVARNMPKLSSWLKQSRFSIVESAFEFEAVDGDFDGMFKSLSQPVTQVLKMQKYSEETSKLREIAKGLLAYEAKHGSFPPAYSVDAAGKPLHSWRVLILPFIEQRNLYNQFRMDEPWDSDHNLKVATSAPVQYLIGDADAKDGVVLTRMLAMVSDDSAIRRNTTKFQDIIDGTVNTVSVAVGSRKQAVVWTKPEDITATPQKIAKQMKAANPEGFWAATCDSGLHFISADADEKKLAWAFQINDGNLLSPNGDRLSEALASPNVPDPMYDPSDLIPRWWTDYLIPVPWESTAGTRR